MGKIHLAPSRPFLKQAGIGSAGAYRCQLKTQYGGRTHCHPFQFIDLSFCEPEQLALNEANFSAWLGAFETKIKIFGHLYKVNKHPILLLFASGLTSPAEKYLVGK